MLDAFFGSNGCKHGAWLAAALAMLAAPRPASANLCPGPADAVGEAEAERLELEAFSSGAPGDRDYNALLITCNRDRDSHGQRLDAASASNDFENDLDPRTVRGNYDYFGLPLFLPYGYQLERVAGEWIVTVPIAFHLPSPQNLKRNVVDIPQDLAESLGLAAPGEICEPGHAVYTAEPRRLLQGFLSYFCRVPRDMVAGTMSVLNHLRVYWIDAITAIWNRPGFTLHPLFVDCEEPPEGTTSACDPSVTDDQLAVWRLDNTVWDIHFNLHPYDRASYTRWLLQPNPMHSGIGTTTLAHELGHYLGLDDEYGEDSESPNDCDNVLPGASYEYLMCSTAAGANGIKGVYPWLITRRYTVGQPFPCVEDAACGEGSFCSLEGGVRPHCVPARDQGESCLRNAQCGAGLICKGRPFGTCQPDDRCGDDLDCAADHYCAPRPYLSSICRPKGDDGAWCSADRMCLEPYICGGLPVGRCLLEGSRELGESCYADTHCATGACSATPEMPFGGCVCQSDGDCESTQFCNHPLLGPNRCDPLRSEYAPCTRDGQCVDPLVCVGEVPLCSEDGTKEVGEGCLRNLECASGRCGAGAICRCVDDADCPEGKTCHTPLFSGSYCK